MQYRLINIGRGKVNRTIELPDSVQGMELELALIRECRKYLASRGVDVTWDAETRTGLVSAGFHEVGRIETDSETDFRATRKSDRSAQHYTDQAGE